MKKIASLLVLALLPAMIFAQKTNQVNVPPQEPANLKVNIPAYSVNIPAAAVNMTFLFDMQAESLQITMNSGGVKSANYSKVWIPQHEFQYSEMPNYTKQRGIKVKKAKTYVDQENFLNLPATPIAAGIKCEGMTFDGIYKIVAPKNKKEKKNLDNQMIPLDGKKSLVLNFKVTPNTENVTLTLCNPIPMKGSSEMQFKAEDVVIDIHLDRCKENQALIATAKEYEKMFKVGETSLTSMLKTSRSLVPTAQKMLLEQFASIDAARFNGTGCSEIQTSYDNMMASVERIRTITVKQDKDDKDKETKCDVKSLNAEIKSTTAKLNTMCNDWSTASGADKDKKKAAFQATVKAFDDKLNSLPAGCKDKLDSALMKKYDFVKKLVK
jgi:hypothetical protein